MFLVGFILPVGLETGLKFLTNCTVVKIIDAVLSVIPVLQLYNAQLNLMLNYIQKNYQTLNGNAFFTCRGIFTEAWQIVIFFIFQTVAYLIFTILIDNAKIKVYKKKKNSKPIEEPHEEVPLLGDADRARADTLKPDNDVWKEAQKV